MFQRKALFPVPAILVLLLAACGGATPTEPSEPQEEPTTAAEEPTAAEVEAPTATEEPPAADPAWQTQLPPLDAAPQDVEIPVNDTRTLAGRYYPAKVNPAPIVVLMHWAGGDMTDWREIAPWLQNRADEQSRAGAFARPVGQVEGPWLDPSWFPAILSEASFGVLVFDYNGFGLSPYDQAGDSLLQDSLAAMVFASQLEGADPNILLAAGASIGADGAVDGCYLFNELVAAGEAQGQCLGALSLSPGNFLTGTCSGDCPPSFFSYADAVAALSEDEHLVFCLAAEDDVLSSEVCKGAQGDFYTTYIYSGDPHGMMLVDPTLSPSDPAMDVNALELLLDFLAMSIGRNVTP